VTVNGRELTRTDCYLGSAAVPVALFGADADRLTVAVEVHFPDEPLPPVREERTVTIE
jgi:hypothetical protein